MLTVKSPVSGEYRVKQVDRFIEIARALECDEDKERFEEKLGKIAKATPGKPALKTQNGRFKMISRLLATLVMLLLAFVAFWDNTLNDGYFATITGFLFLLLAVVIWFKWGTIGRIFYAAEGKDPIIETGSKVVGHMIFHRHDPSSHHSPSSNR